MDDARQQPGPACESTGAGRPEAGGAVEAGDAVPAMPVAALAAPAFCRGCGASWQEGWIECPACAARARHAIEAKSAPATDDLKSIKQSVALYFTLLAVCMIGLIASQAGGKAIAVDLGVGIALSGVVLLWAGVNRRDALVPLARVPHAGWFFAAIGLGVLTFAIAMGVMYLLRQLFQVPQGEMSDPYRQAGFGWGAVIVAIAVQPAVIEELAFRGIITSALLRALTPFEAIMVGALMFMILHLSPARFPHTLALGVAAGFLRVRTGSLYPCMLLHFTHNFLCVGVEWAGIG